MPKIAKEMTATDVRRLTKPGNYSVGGVHGLMLRVEPTGSKRWILRFTVGGKRRDAGLGGYPTVTLAQAREEAREMRAQARRGLDPVQDRKAARDALRAAQANLITFAQATERFLKKKQSAWSNPKHRKQWASTLEAYAYPALGSMAVADIQVPDVRRALEPIWEEKPETASRVRGRIERVLDYAKAAGHRDGENPARWRGNLDALLPGKGEIAKVRHHRAIPWQEMPEFMQELRDREEITAKALGFLVLTAARSGEVRGARWAEIDLDAEIWTVPAERMKAKKQHVVPLSKDAIALLREMPRLDGSPFVFPAARGGELSDMALSALMRRMGGKGTPHGMRSAFRDWCAETTAYPREVAEQALAHTIPSAVERAYRRGNLLDKRRRLMADWAAFLLSPGLSKGVTPIREKNG